MTEKKKRKSRGGVYFRESIHGVCVNRGKRGNWWIDYYTGPTLKDRIREKTKALSRTEAATIRNAKLTDHERGELRLTRKNKTLLLHSLSEEYLAAAKINKPKSVRLDVAYQRRIREHFGDVPVRKITRSDCERFKNTLTEEWQRRAWAKAEGKPPEVRLGTVDRYVGALKRLFNWAIDMEKVEVNPAARVKLHRQDGKPFYLLSEDEEELLLQAAEEGKAAHLRPIIVLALATTMRKDEILGLRWDQVDLESEMITLAGTDTKNKEVKHVPLNADALAVLREQKPRAEGGNYVFHRKGKRFSDTKTAWRYARTRAGLPDKIRFHDLRHTAISRMVNRGVPELIVGRIAGWTDSSAPFMLRRYSHQRPDHLHKAVKGLEKTNRSHNVVTKETKETLQLASRRTVSA
jgi:integrase